jgi:hypothetical protein
MVLAAIGCVTTTALSPSEPDRSTEQPAESRFLPPLSGYDYEPNDDFQREIGTAIEASLEPTATLCLSEAVRAVGPDGDVSLMAFTLEIDAGTTEEAFGMLLEGMAIGLEAEPEPGLDGQGYVLRGPRSTSVIAPYGDLGADIVFLLAMGDPDAPVEKVAGLLLGNE